MNKFKTVAMRFHDDLFIEFDDDTMLFMTGVWLVTALAGFAISCTVNSGIPIAFGLAWPVFGVAYKLILVGKDYWNEVD